MSFRLCGAVAGALALLATSAHADTPDSGVGGIAMSPDGSRLVAVTESRGLYVLDPASLEITGRHWLRTSPVSVLWSADGARLFVRDTSDTVWVLKADDFSVEREIDDVKHVSYASGADILFITLFAYDRDARRNDTTVVALNGQTFEEIGKVELDAEAQAIAVTPDASMVAILTKPFDSEAETKESTPSSVTGLEREVFEHKHDAEEAQIIVITDRGQTVTTTNTWYSDFSQPEIAIVGGKIWVAPYSGTVASLDPATGEATLLDTGITYNYGAGFSADGAVLLGGGLRDFAITKTDGSAAPAKFSLQQLPGWPEYHESFYVLPDGSFYAGSSAFVLYKFDATGKQVAQQPLF